jgi:hypothetical protein
VAEPTEPVLDFVIVLIPEGVDINDPQEEVKLENVAMEQLMLQYARKGSRPPRALLLTKLEWVFTSDPEAVAQVQPGDGCPACLAGNDQARAFLNEHPDRTLALGNITYQEIW